MSRFKINTDNIRLDDTIYEVGDIHFDTVGTTYKLINVSKEEKDILAEYIDSVDYKYQGKELFLNKLGSLRYCVLVVYAK